MVDLYALTWRFGHLISHNISIAALISSHNQAKCPCNYAATKFINLGNVKIKETDNSSRNPPPFLTSDFLHQFSQDSTTPSAIASSLDPSTPYIKTLHIQMLPSPNICTISPLCNSITPNTAMATFHIPQSLEF